MAWFRKSNPTSAPTTQQPVDLSENSGISFVILNLNPTESPLSQLELITEEVSKNVNSDLVDFSNVQNSVFYGTGVQRIALDREITYKGPEYKGSEKNGKSLANIYLNRQYGTVVISLYDHARVHASRIEAGLKSKSFKISDVEKYEVTFVEPK